MTETKKTNTNTRATLSKEYKDSIKERDKKCFYCGCNNPLFLTVDHKTPIASGGKNDAKNLVTSCMQCNSLKGSKSVADYRKYIQGLKKLKELGHVHIQGANIHVRYEV